MTCGVDVFKLGVAVRVRSAFADLPIGLQTVTGRCSNMATVRSPTGCPWFCSSLASFRVLLHVHRSGDSGSPRVNGSTNRSNASRIDGSDSLIDLRPPPTRRIRLLTTRCRGPFTRSRSSRTPRPIVLCDIPVAATTAATPPHPTAVASAAAHCRRTRSSITGPSDLNFCRIRLIRAASCMPLLPTF